jgi:hypothetical protein
MLTFDYRIAGDRTVGSDSSDKTAGTGQLIQES